jgi:hypothetical protein
MRRLEWPPPTPITFSAGNTKPTNSPNAANTNELVQAANADTRWYPERRTAPFIFGYRSMRAIVKGALRAD